MLVWLPVRNLTGLWFVALVCVLVVRVGNGAFSLRQRLRCGVQIRWMCWTVEPSGWLAVTFGLSDESSRQSRTVDRLCFAGRFGGLWFTESSYLSGLELWFVSTGLFLVDVCSATWTDCTVASSNDV